MLKWEPNRDVDSKALKNDEVFGNDQGPGGFTPRLVPALPPVIARMASLSNSLLSVRSLITIVAILTLPCKRFGGVHYPKRAGGQGSADRLTAGEAAPFAALALTLGLSHATA